MTNAGRLLARVLFVFLSAFVSSTSATAQEGDTPRPALRPNILLLMAEDMSAHVGAFGDPVARTPHLDELAREGVRFTQVFTTAGVCAPSRAALMLGLHQISTGTQHMRAYDRAEGGYLAVPPPGAKAFPERLRRAGYFTYQHAKNDYQFSGPLSGSGPFSIWDAEDNEGQWADREAGQPFFGMINYLVTHESGLFEPLGTWPRGGMHFVMQVMQAYRRWGFTGELVPTRPEDVPIPPYYPDVPEVRRDLARLHDNVQIMDAKVGTLLDRLEADGLADTTIVIWTTDHGDGLPRAKRELFDSGIHVPMIIRFPESLRPAHYAKGDVDARLISFVDLTATLLGLAQVPPPRDRHGQDFLATREPIREFVFASRDRIDETPDRQRAVRSARYKYIRSFRPELPGGHPSEFRENLPIVRALAREYRAGRLNEDQRRWFEPPGEERLFDLEEDPFELANVSRDPDHRDALESLRAAYQQWRARVPDWGDEPEAQMAKRFQPEGQQEITSPPRFAYTDGRLQIDSQSPAASIDYRVVRGRARSGRESGDQAHPRRWRPYTEPLSLAPGSEIEARAVRYGWQESETVPWIAPRE